jgi:hypothetical protein
LRRGWRRSAATQARSPSARLFARVLDGVGLGPRGSPQFEFGREIRRANRSVLSGSGMALHRPSARPPGSAKTESLAAVLLAQARATHDRIHELGAVSFSFARRTGIIEGCMFGCEPPVLWCAGGSFFSILRRAAGEPGPLPGCSWRIAVIHLNDRLICSAAMNRSRAGPHGRRLDARSSRVPGRGRSARSLPSPRAAAPGLCSQKPLKSVTRMASPICAMRSTNSLGDVALGEWTHGKRWRATEGDCCG